MSQSVKKASQSLPPQRQKESKSVFGRGAYVDKNTAQAASVEFVRHRRTNYARSRLQPFGGKARRAFSTRSDSVKDDVFLIEFNHLI